MQRKQQPTINNTTNLRTREERIAIAIANAPPPTERSGRAKWALKETIQQSTANNQHNWGACLSVMHIIVHLKTRSAKVKRIGRMV